MLTVTPLSRRSNPPGFDFHIHEDGFDLAHVHIHEDGTARVSFLEPPTHAFTVTFDEGTPDEMHERLAPILVKLLKDDPRARVPASSSSNL
ncbi:hypothetical protein [Deinococcus yavapaiensis]|uniref:Uncharacterized protein n=1 Tax=Deinococcus yavapaiensis KR-236 TaxID=694435 RepID=A0A318SG29_9DEIO|nr:hypothetical protein [Deinococcus yavapaiensis]PYE48376.1 hypothetical protein DES52_13019 [Deinococcus yavapaiensis KR-236]